jgi:hypothetical protein
MSSYLAADSAAQACLGLRKADPEVSSKKRCSFSLNFGGGEARGKISTKP